MSQIAASVAAMRSSFVAYLVWLGGVVLSTCGAMSVFGSAITGGRLPAVGVSLAALLAGVGLLFAAKLIHRGLPVSAAFGRILCVMRGHLLEFGTIRRERVDFDGTVHTLGVDHVGLCSRCLTIVSD